jgi:AraC-like DNA-binding protein
VPTRVEALGRERCSGCDLPRHRHVHGYLTVVLGGSYFEAGDAGRFRAAPGTVLIHRPYEAHLDRFAAKGADVLNLPLIGAAPRVGAVRIDDPDAIVRLAEKSAAEAAEAIWLRAQPVQGESDWPDLLALALRKRPQIRISDWARQQRLHPSAVSREFAQAFGITPCRFRAEAKARLALRSLACGEAPLADVSAAAGFSDQAHMTRAVASLTGMSPGRWRDRLKSIQYGSGSAR